MKRLNFALPLLLTATLIGTSPAAKGQGTNSAPARSSLSLDALVAEHGDAIALMQAVKRALDPHDILNPGKTVPP